MFRLKVILLPVSRSVCKVFVQLMRCKQQQKGGRWGVVDEIMPVMFFPQLPEASFLLWFNTASMEEEKPLIPHTNWMSMSRNPSCFWSVSEGQMIV